MTDVFFFLVDESTILLASLAAAVAAVEVDGARLVAGLATGLEAALAIWAAGTAAAPGV